jgi:hypothetical protein
MSHRTSTSRVRSKYFSTTVHDVKNCPDYVLSMNSSVRSQRKSNLQPLRPYYVYNFLLQQHHASVPTYTAQRLESYDPLADIFNLSFTVLWLLDSSLYQALQGASLSRLLLRERKLSKQAKTSPDCSCTAAMVRSIQIDASTIPLHYRVCLPLPLLLH